MAKINLLPWREEQRKQQSQDFIKQLVLVSALSAVLAYAGYNHVSHLLDDQMERLKYIQQQTAHLQGELKEITTLENTKKKLLDRMNIVQDLQGGRPRVVHMFYEIAHTIPKGVFLKSLKQVNDKLEIEGEADSNGNVSNYMKRLGESEWFLDPELAFIKTDPVSRNSIFKLTIKLTNPNMNKG